MNPEDKLKQTKLVLNKLANYYRTTLNKEQIQMYANDLQVLTIDEMVKAIQIYRADPKNEFFPLPGKLVSIIRPVENELDEGRVVAGRIMTAIGKFGSYRWMDAKVWMGELAENVVLLQGGWKSICELDSEQIKAEQPRWRDMAVTLSKRSKLGKLHEAPALPKPVTSGMTSLGDIAKNLLEQEKETK